MPLTNDRDTITAIATPPGVGGIGVVRISGADLNMVMDAVLTRRLPPRQAVYTDFKAADGEVIDRGIALYFPAPHSFTGEDVLELQAHGGPVILDRIVHATLATGARLARPGEFSERAFLNGKLDLVQAEAIADLIGASTEQAARGALRSLQGAFSQRIQELLDALIALRVQVESAIDFPEEEIDFLGDSRIADALAALLEKVDRLMGDAQQGSLLSEGMTVVIAGKPNAGKSSLLNALAGKDAAIVTEVPGTTRDVLREKIHLDGMPLHVVDTAGLRYSPDEIEREGVRRAWLEIEQADRILFVVDSAEDYSLDPGVIWPEFFQRYPEKNNLTFILNKSDKSAIPNEIREGKYPVISLSAKSGRGLDLLINHLEFCMGYRADTEGMFTARRRHFDALQRTRQYLIEGQNQLIGASAGELLAEDLRQAHRALGEITGAFSSDDLLDRIFSSFCIGK